VRSRLGGPYFSYLFGRIATLLLLRSLPLWDIRVISE